MTTFFRFILLLLKRPWRQNTAPDDAVLSVFRVWPWECDFNIHLTNSRYCVWLDSARVQYFAEIGAARLFLKAGWRSVLASQTMTYIREIPPMKKITVRTSLLHWDKKYLYLEHNFMAADTLHAKAVSRVAVLHRGSVQPFDAMLNAIGRQVPVNMTAHNGEAMPEVVKAKIALLQAKRDTESKGNE
ncbi:thioesterase family protein [Alteromonas sp. CYL-A6]|uniref:thioesterase family protein n=1 Tax=Alteromonas nitratireducens TaxID=3390813 RepID=UPI0034BA1D85